MPHRSPWFNHSFRLMLYLEWILLGITLLGEIRPSPHGLNTATLPLSIFILIGFGLMGLKLPTQKLRSKVIYTSIEFGLLFLLFLLNGHAVFLPLAGLIMVIRSCLIFEQTGRLIVTGLVFISFLLVIFQQSPPPHLPRHGPPPDLFSSTILTLKLNTTVIFGLALLLTLLLVNALLAERQSREKLIRANDQLRQYALRVEDQATLQERNRIAREIHDALGHALTAQSIQLENALLFLPPDSTKTTAFLREAQQLGATALQEVRRSVSTLRSNPLQGQSLEGAIAKAIDEFRLTTGIEPDCTIQLSRSLSSDLNTALYRIIQEALTNIYKHSRATQVNLSLREHLDWVHLQIKDNGQGFDTTGNTTGFGLQGMRERTMALGGQFFLVSQLGQGCHITVSIPLPKLAL